MNRNEKKKLVRDLTSGRVKLKDLHTPVWETWVNAMPGQYQCGTMFLERKQMIERMEELRDRVNFIILNICSDETIQGGTPLTLNLKQ